MSRNVEQASSWAVKKRKRGANEPYTQPGFEKFEACLQRKLEPASQSAPARPLNSAISLDHPVADSFRAAHDHVSDSKAGVGASINRSTENLIQQPLETINDTDADTAATADTQHKNQSHDTGKTADTPNNGPSTSRKRNPEPQISLPPNHRFFFTILDNRKPKKIRVALRDTDIFTQPLSQV